MTACTKDEKYGVENRAVVSGTFPWLGAGTVFSLYAGLMVLQLLWVIGVVPKTRGIPLEEVGPQLGLKASVLSVNVKLFQQGG